MPLIIASTSAHPASPTLRQVLLGAVATAPPVANAIRASADTDSIIIWSHERLVRATDYQPVTLWAASARHSTLRQSFSAATDRDAISHSGTIPKILPISGLVAGRELDTNQQPSSDYSLLTPDWSGQPAAAPLLNPTARRVASDSNWASAEIIETTQKTIPTKRAVLRFVLLSIMFISLIVMASVVIPDVYYRLQPEKVSDVTNGRFAPVEEVIVTNEPPAPALPAVDPSLPAGEWLRIPTIGVNAGIMATINPDEALEQGAWMVPDFGRPTDFSQPTIIAAHRYGWIWWWQSDFGRRNSFFYLPETKLGDRIEVITDQRRFEYEIYAKEEGKSITDYSADLILYTCKFLNSPERYFVYAKRIAPNEPPTAQESQSSQVTSFDKT